MAAPARSSPSFHSFQQAPSQPKANSSSERAASVSSRLPALHPQIRPPTQAAPVRSTRGSGANSTPRFTALPNPNAHLNPPTPTPPANGMWDLRRSISETPSPGFILFPD